MSAQLEDGYTRTANELLDCLMKQRLNGTQHSIIYCIIRNTYGYQRKSHELSLTFIASATSIHKDLIKRELDKLIELKIVKVFREAGFKTTREIGINKNTGDWIVQSGLKERQSTNQSTVSESVAAQYTNQSTPTVDQSVYQEINNKDIKESSTTTDPVEKVFKAYCRINDKAEHHAYGQYKLIELKINEGYDPDMIIEVMEEKSNGNVNTFRYYDKALAERKLQSQKPVDTKSLTGAEWAKAAGFGGGT